MIRILWLVKLIVTCAVLFVMELGYLTRPEGIQVTGYHNLPICLSWKERKKIEEQLGIDYGHMRNLKERIEND